MSSNCLACGKSDLRQILNFGEQAAANLLSDKPFEDIHKELLALQYCDHCGHSQQEVFYPCEKLFSHYLYQSGTSKTLREYFDWLAAAIAKGRPEGVTTLELASNDGSFMKALARKGLKSEGVEPAHNLVELCHQEGLKVTEGFWPEVSVHGPFDNVVAMNVVAHTPNPFAFMQGVRKVLSEDGVAYIQASQVDMFDNFEFDTLYHEHFSFYSPASILFLSQRAGFKYGRFVKTNIHGGSLLALLGNNEATLDRAFQAMKGGEFYLNELSADKRPDALTASRFAARATNTCDTVKISAALAKKSGYTIVLVGAAAKAITVLQSSGVQVDYVVDEAPLKLGLYIPGTNLKIESLLSIQDVKGPIFFIVGAWNFYEELCRKIKGIKEEI